MNPTNSLPAGAQNPARPADPQQNKERTSFQSASKFDPAINLRSDVVMCYGIDPTIGDRIAQWKARGYRVHLMTGVAWGEYQDYLYGRWDGVNHEDEVQTEANGQKIGHGGDVYYMSPGVNYGKYLTVGVKRALDAGAEGIHLEEPEFWVRAGWSEGFKREWKAYYGEDWVSPTSSPDAQYRASKLKYYLYGRALKQVFDFVKQYNKEHGTNVKCYVPTHSLINYSSWGIVSPESSLVKVGADGFIAQVWTGTARTPNFYNGLKKERTFETAFMEYGVMMNVVRANGGTVWFLNDPIEDNPDHSWRDYRNNWHSTLTASLLWPQVWRQEVMPWPERIFHGRYPVLDRTERPFGERVRREPIPSAYATELMTVINALNHLDQRKVNWDCGTQGVGVVVSDTMMFQRFGPDASDADLGSFYGLAMPLVKRGIPVEPVQLENATQKDALKPYKVLLATFEGMKPMNAEDSAALAAWVKGGGVLVFVDNDRDPFNKVRSWWNEGSNHYDTPRAAFFAQLGLPTHEAPGTHKVGKGALIYEVASPAEWSHRQDGGNQVRVLVEKACQAAKVAYRETNYLALRRGPYLVAAGLDESVAEPPKELNGRFIDLFDASLAIVPKVSLDAGSRHLLLDLDRTEAKAPAVLASACKTLGEEKLPDGTFRFYAEAPDNTEAAVRVLLSAQPKSVKLDGQELPAEARSWDPATRTLLLRFANSANGHWITLK